LGTFMLATAALYWGRPVLMPLTVAVLLTFLLNPVVNGLHRNGLRRPFAVLLVVFCMFSLLGTVTYALGTQVTALAAEIPQYKDNIIRKISEFRASGRSRALQRLERTLVEILGELERPDGSMTNAPEAGKAVDQKPMPVVVKGDKNPVNLLAVLAQPEATVQSPAPLQPAAASTEADAA
jgi:predicted PurR-regulated permease PerM